MGRRICDYNHSKEVESIKPRNNCAGENGIEYSFVAATSQEAKKYLAISVTAPVADEW
ncbi:MAG: hypothetical protein HOI21_13780 [Bacteroidetes Order II. Incertae sedis bacterium]|jgi:hypothetical protein|nr:hypothetical protein [Bacteroidetes Order II. bacterium]